MEWGHRGTRRRLVLQTAFWLDRRHRKFPPRCRCLVHEFGRQTLSLPLPLRSLAPRPEAFSRFCLSPASGEFSPRQTFQGFQISRRKGRNLGRRTSRSLPTKGASKNSPPRQRLLLVLSTRLRRSQFPPGKPAFFRRPERLSSARKTRPSRAPRRDDLNCAPSIRAPLHHHRRLNRRASRLLSPKRDQPS